MRIIPAVLLAAAVSLPLATSASAAANILGSWKGRGSVKLTNGQVEPVSCSVRYEPGGDVNNKTILLYATCATTAGTFVQSGRVIRRGGSSYSGRLFSQQYSVSGDVSISVSGSSQTVRVSSPKGSGSLSLRKQ